MSVMNDMCDENFRLQERIADLEQQLAEAQKLLRQARNFIRAVYGAESGIVQCGNDKTTAFDLDATIAGEKK